jgi:hypothetical protein
VVGIRGRFNTIKELHYLVFQLQQARLRSFAESATPESNARTTFGENALACQKSRNAEAISATATVKLNRDEDAVTGIHLLEVAPFDPPPLKFITAHLA